MNKLDKIAKNYAYSQENETYNKTDLEKAYKAGFEKAKIAIWSFYWHKRYIQPILIELLGTADEKNEDDIWSSFLI